MICKKMVILLERRMGSKIQALEQVAKVVYLIPPSLAVLVSTLGENQIRNLAPFSMFMVCSYRPPMLALGINPSTDTCHNILASREFVVGMPRPELAAKLYKTASNFPPEADEFVEAGFTPYPSPKVRPFRISECQVNLDCKLRLYERTGNRDLLVGEVVAADIDEELFSQDQVKLRSALAGLYHISGPNFLLGGEKVKV